MRDDSGEKAHIFPSERPLIPMKGLMLSLADRSRTPSNDILAAAFRDFFSVRVQAPGVLTGYHSRLLVITWKHLKARQDELDDDDWQMVFSTKNLEEVLFVLSEAKYAPSCYESIQTVARFAFQEICANCAPEFDYISEDALIAYVNLLSLHGNPDEARQVVERFWSWWKQQSWERPPWLTVMKGFAINGDRRQLQEVARILEQQKGEAFDAAYHKELINELIEEDHHPDAVRAMFECPLTDNAEPSLSTKVAVISFAIKKGEISWARPIFESIPPAAANERNAETMKVTLLWEAAHGKGASEIAEIVASWAAAANEEDSTLAKKFLGTPCVSELADVATSMDNVQKARRFISLASKWGIERDSLILISQLKSTIVANDVDLALKTCRKMGQDFEEVALKNVPLMNKLITMMSNSNTEQHQQEGDNLFEQVSTIADPLFENGTFLEPETVAALTRMLLFRRNDLEAVVELLRPILGTYEPEGQAEIGKAMIDYIVEAEHKQTNEDAVWDAYRLIQILFPKTNVSDRTKIMNTFFARGKSRRACLVFGHMRQVEHDMTLRPTADTYALCLQGIAKAGDEENLELVHNMLKLDLEVDMNSTRILNGLMYAYTGCNMAERSMGIFRTILQSEEGPTHETIQIFFKMCEKHFNGTQEAIKMMNKAKLLEIDVDRRMYTGFISALAAQCDFDLAVDAVEKMESEIGEVPTLHT